MSRSTSKRILWFALAALLPLPFFLVVDGRVPALGVLELGLVSLVLLLVEGSQGVIGIVVALLLGQAILQLALLWLIAGTLARLFSLRSRRTAALLTAALVVTGLLVACRFNIYRTPFRRDSPTANLLHVYG